MSWGQSGGIFAVDPYVYVVQREDGLVKIGTSKDPRQRIRLLECEHGDLHVWACVPGGRAEEKWLHRKWKHVHSHLEWFHPDEELLNQCDDGRLLDRPGGLCKYGSAGSPASGTYAGRVAEDPQPTEGTGSFACL